MKAVQRYAEREKRRIEALSIAIFYLYETKKDDRILALVRSSFNYYALIFFTKRDVPLFSVGIKYFLLLSLMLIFGEERVFGFYVLLLDTAINVVLCDFNNER